MNDRTVEILADRVEREFLPYVRGPGRYIGGEVNQIKKDLAACDFRVALCFPDTYEVGMSNTGLAILYHVLNELDGVAAERVFAPWHDAEAVLRDRELSLFSLESKASLKSFDVVGFSLTNELCYTNVLNMLDLSGVAVRRDRRGEDDPLIIAGGGMANCGEPMADFVDLFILGEGEAAVTDLAALLRAAKKHGRSKRETLRQIARECDWAYAPQFYRFDYEGLRIVAFRATDDSLRRRFANAVVRDFENAPVPTAPIVPFPQAVHERISVEVMRGCPGRCRFCQASFCRRPIRYRSIEKVFELAKASYHATGFDTVSLLSLSSADYPQLEDLVGRLQAYFEDKHVGVSVPSLRVDQQLKLLPRLLTSVRKSGLTIAVEAASERLRRIINKPLADNDLCAAVTAAYEAGWQRLKLYFMVGLPGETLDDVRRIVALSCHLAKRRKHVDGKTGQINITVSWFVPKPHTPLGWWGQRPREYFEEARQLILDEKTRLRARFLQFKFHNIGRSILEAALGRGDRRVANVIEDAWRAGARFDLWNECFDEDLWRASFERHGMDLGLAARRHFATDEILPWRHLGGPRQEYLLAHHSDAMTMLAKP
jgi:radical SAM family uncharacterized protein